MAVRFYFSSTTIGSPTPGFAAWTRTSEGFRARMSSVKDGSALTTKTFWANAAAAANDSCLCAQFHSPPLPAGVAFATTDTIKCQIRCAESGTNDNINRQPICLKVYGSDGSTLRATLKALGHYGPNTTEWISGTLTNKRLADGDTLDANYTTVAGDFLVLEVGGQVSALAGTSVTGSMDIGSSGAGADLGENETDSGATLNPWFEISRTFTFLYTATASLTVGAATLSATATFKTFHTAASVPLTAGAATLSATASFTAPSAGTVAGVLNNRALLLLLSPEEFVEPAVLLPRTATASLSAGAATLSASATFEEYFRATAALTAGPATLAAASTFEEYFRATASLTVGPATLSSAATFRAVTRFYLDNGAAHVAPAFDASWARTSEADRARMSTVKSGSAMASKDSGDAASDFVRVLSRQFVSPPMQAGIAFTTADVARGVVRVKELHAGDNVGFTMLCLRVLDAAGTTVRATLLPRNSYRAQNEWSDVTLTNRVLADGDALQASYTTQAGDVLVLEVGGHTAPSGGTTVLGTHSFGSDSGSDLAFDDTSTDAFNPWFEITASEPITFVFTAAASLTVGAATLSASATFGANQFEGTAALTAGAATLSSSATYDPPDRTAAASLTAPAATLSSSATFKTYHTATAAVVAPAATLSASATYDPPDRTATSALVVGAATLSAVSSVMRPAPAIQPAYLLLLLPDDFVPDAATPTIVRTATAALTVGPATLSSSATFQAPVYTAAASLTAPHATFSASATFAAPVYTASAPLVAPAATLSSAAAFTTVTRTGAASLTAPAATFSALASFSLPTRTASASLTVGGAALSASVTFVAPAVVWREDEAGEWYSTVPVAQDWVGGAAASDFINSSVPVEWT